MAIDMEALYQGAEAGNLADLGDYCAKYINALVKKYDLDDEAEVTYTIPQPADFRKFTLLHYNDRFVLGGRSSVTEDLETVKAEVVKEVKSQLSRNRTLFGFAATTVGGLRGEFFSVYFSEVKTLGGGPVNFKTDGAAIDDIIKHVMDVSEHTYFPTDFEA